MAKLCAASGAKVIPAGEDGGGCAFQLSGAGFPLASCLCSLTLPPPFLGVKAGVFCVSDGGGVPLLAGWAFWLGKPMGQGDKALKSL